jgi:large subunit ribosomal protein L23
MIHPGKILHRPRITEKAAILAESSSAYVFEISKEASKATVAQAIKALYKVTPRKVNIVKLRKKALLTKGKKGSTKEIRKAYVYLSKGDKIELA